MNRTLITYEPEVELTDEDLEPEAQVGKKYDTGKLRWSLLPWGAVEWAVKVLEHGATKYGDNNWQLVENGAKRYNDALIRHTAAIQKGETLDPESGLPHLAHVAVNALFLLHLNFSNKT